MPLAGARRRGETPAPDAGAPPKEEGGDRERGNGGSREQVPRRVAAPGRAPGMSVVCLLPGRTLPDGLSGIGTRRRGGDSGAYSVP